MTLTTLFDIVAKEAGSRHPISREGFVFLAVCSKSEIAVSVRAESGPKWGSYGVSMLDARHPESLASGTSQQPWHSDQVRETLNSIRDCESVTVILGGETIETRLDDHSTIREVTHRPLLAPGETLDTVLAELRHRYGVPPLDASPPIGKSP
jgi:hypothetical protein